jgi:hypothetical protein
MTTMTTAEPEQPLIISTHDLLPPGRRFWLDDSMFAFDEKTQMIIPHFSVQETAKVFFGKGPDWLRWRMRPDKPNDVGNQRFPEGYFLLDGEPMDFKRKPTSRRGRSDDNTARYFTLADIERMAHALTQVGAMDGVRLANIVMMVRTCARLYGVA